MTKFINKIGSLMAGIALGAFALTSCSEKIDEGNLYTFTGQTVIDYLRSNPDLSEFVQISDSAGMSDRLSAYGTYTCFAPTNEAVETYLQGLWDDNTRSDHNKLYDDATLPLMERLMRSEKRDSLCKDIVEAQITGQKQTSNDLLTGNSITMMGGNSHIPKVVNDSITIDGVSKLIERDLQMENGIVHIIDKMFFRSNNYITDEMESMGVYKIWVDALKATGLDKQLQERERTSGISWFEIDPENAYPFADYPTACKVGYTIFAEPDAVLEQNGITDWQSLAAKAKDWYASSASWYSYVQDHGIEVSTGTDYENQWNVLNMFLRYHILKYVVPTDKLVYSFNEITDIDVYEYYRTMLPYTMFKVTGIKDHGSVSKLFINRQLNTPTLTSVPGSTSRTSESYLTANQVVNEGIQIDGSRLKINSRQASNGYIHPINGILVYNQDVPNKVLNERMRFDFMSLLDESMTNNFRGASGKDLISLFGRTDRTDYINIRVPEGYFENMKIYNGEASKVYYLVKDEAKCRGANEDCWNDYQGDELYVLGAYDFAVKLPPVPKTGTYELRFGYVNNGARTIVQFYLGNSSDRASMQPIDIPLNQNVQATTIGWTDPSNETDLGAATDKAMHNRGWMRGPNYFSNYKGGANQLARFKGTEGQQHIRRIVTKQTFEQGKEYWFRCKTAMPENLTAQFELDYIELVPANVYNNSTLTEDVF